MADDPPDEKLSYRIRRNAGGLMSRLPIPGAFADFARQWRAHRWLRWSGYAIALLLVIWFVIWITIARSLPSADKLLDYQPPLPTMVRGADGSIVYSYARERRVQLGYVDFPKTLINAFIAAEDKNFFTHGGVDFVGLGEAVFDYGLKFGSGQRARGGSTITQQVAKNILLGNEYSITRKLKEMIVARRIEQALTKQQILELYLNEIPLGRQSFGVQAAARAYFNKDVGDLSLTECAFLASLPKAPEKYGRAKNVDEAIARRNYVLDQMAKNGFIGRSDAQAAMTQPLGLVARRVETYDSSVGYFVEEVRRRLIDQYGENADDGKNSVYAGGLWVRTSLDPTLQKASLDALRAGLIRYSSGKGWPGPIAHIDLDQDKWQGQLLALNKTISYKDWRVGLVLRRSGSLATIGFPDGVTAPLTGLPDPLRAGDVVTAAPDGGGWALRSIPGVSGGMLVEEPFSGRVLAMQGGFDAGLDSFNRATQAERQPGSAIKPFVYATALDYGMTPASIVPDEPFCVFQGAALGQKCFKNFGDEGSGGLHTMRWGLEQSRNLMTVHIANQIGMPRVVHNLSRWGIGDYQPYLSFALGAGDTTVGQMVNAYATLANGGVQYDASPIDYIQDRSGKVIWRVDERHCDGCNMAQWDGRPMPRLAPRGSQVMDPRTAYQVVHMLEGVIIRGTGIALHDLGLPLFGKTGTTTGPTNVWFVGGSGRIVGGVYLGYDHPRSLGGYAQGATYAVPMFKQFVQESMGLWTHDPFLAPNGVRMVKIDRVSGQRVFGGTPSDDAKAPIIWEAFKPETEPQRPSRESQLAAKREDLMDAIRRGFAARSPAGPQAPLATEPGLPQDFAAQQGGVY